MTAIPPSDLQHARVTVDYTDGSIAQSDVKHTQCTDSVSLRLSTQGYSSEMTDLVDSRVDHFLDSSR